MYNMQDNLRLYFGEKFRVICIICIHPFTAPVMMPVVGSLLSLSTAINRSIIIELLRLWLLVTYYLRSCMAAVRVSLLAAGLRGSSHRLWQFI